MSDEQLDKELKKINKKYADRPLHHYENQPDTKKMRQERWTKIFEWITIIGTIAAILVMIGIIVLIVLVVKGVERMYGL